MDVDETGRDRQAGRINTARRRRGPEIPEGCDPPAANTHIRAHRWSALTVQNRAARDHKIVGLLCGWPRAGRGEEQAEQYSRSKFHFG